MSRKLSLVVAVFSFLCMGYLFAGHASADTFNQNLIIDDGIFNNVNSMNASQIDAFLNTFSNSCISTNSGFKAIDPTGYNPTNGYSYGGYVSAGQVIYDAAQAYGINPQVLITTLEKEQSLVTGRNNFSGWCNNGDQNKYAAAVGYGCPDSGTTYSYTGLSLYQRYGAVVSSSGTTCVNSSLKAGFSQQVIRAAWLLEFGEHRSEGQTSWAVIKGNWDNSDDPQTCYAGPMTQGTFARCPSGGASYYDGYTTIDGTSVHMDSGATAALYWYTPHFSGNQNFFNLFTGWFGRTTGPVYTWQLQSVSYSTGTNVFVTGQTGTVTVKVLNTGNVPWYNYGDSPVRLGTWLPGRVSPLYSPGWLSPDRPANMTENQVQPGSTATFTFPITATQPGTYIEGLNLVAENSQWMPDMGLSPTIKVVPAYQWSINSVTYGNGTGLMTPGTAQQITVKALNTGAVAWSNSSGPPIRLGTWQPGRASQLMPPNGSTGQDWLNSIRPAALTEASVAPGQVGTFTFYVEPPNVGIYYEHFNLVAEGQAWFNDAGLTLYMQGGSYSWQPISTTYSTGSSTVSRGDTLSVTIKAKNTGQVPWSNANTPTSPWPIRIATVAPENRGTMLYDPSWINDVRPATLQETTVQPGGIGTFTFQIHIANNAVSGLHVERFSLVAEGLTWLNDPSFALNLTVR